MRRPPSASSENGTTANASETKRRRDALLAKICHDLRAPLASVTMGANFVLQTTSRDAENARAVKILESMVRSCAQMDRLIRNFADLSEIEGNAVNMRLAEHDAGEMLALAAQGVAQAAASRAITLEVLEPEARVVIRCDREQLSRALSHIVDNAVKFAPEGSTVTLGVLQRDGMVGFEVTDRGAGISDDVRLHIFEREWLSNRADRTGPGFGIAIARGFALAHGGELRFDSNPGETKFALGVPEEGPPGAATQ